MRLVNRKFNRAFGGRNGQMFNRAYYSFLRRGQVESAAEPIGQWDMTFSHSKAVGPWWMF